jgi:exopolysaccharide production protein ExoQ
MIKTDTRSFRLGFAAFVLFTGLAPDFWRDATSWWGYGVIILLVTAGSITMLVQARGRITLRRLPYPLMAFLALATVSLAWSFYPGSTAMGDTAQWVTTIAGLSVALFLSWQDLLRVLGWVLRLILAMSFLFEFIVSVFVRHPVLPVWVVPTDPKHIPALAYWSRDLLFSGAKIQGIVGNSSLLGMIALLAIIVFFVQVMSRSVGRAWGWFWVAVALVTIAITNSSTIYLGIVVVAAVAVMARLVGAATTPRRRRFAYSGIGGVVAVFVIVVAVLHNQIWNVIVKTDILTGRVGIWDGVIHLAQQRPVFGWGWVSYWTPWVEPFKSFLSRGGVQVMHAHNAWLDVWLQLGILGLIVFGALVLATIIRSWIMAVTPVVVSRERVGSWSWLAMLPLLLLTAELVQSLAESRLLIEGGWIMLVVLAVKTKLSPLAVETVATDRERALR